MKFKLIVLFLFSFNVTIVAQNDQEYIQKIYKESLINGKSFHWLNYLSNGIGARLLGSLNAELAIKYTKKVLEELEIDRVWLQPVMVPKWIRGSPEFSFIEVAPGKTIPVNLCALGGSVATPEEGLKAEVVEVNGIEELKAMDSADIHGKIVFFNRQIQVDVISTFKAYNECLNQLYDGAKEAVKLGAVGTIVRSMSLRLDDLPHTGAMSYGNTAINNRIPSAAISTNDAERLSSMLKIDSSIKFYFKQNCKQLNDVKSYNVIGEIKGAQYPKQIITVGGHLNSWDLGDGSHNDGAACVQAMDVLRLLKLIGIKPKRTIRVVLFMNEEKGLRGNLDYTKFAKENNENHIFALESDSGGFMPSGFSFQGPDYKVRQIFKWKNLFEPYLIHYFEKAVIPTDIGPSTNKSALLADLITDSQRYFDHHHASNDNFEFINKRELELGSATMASLVYLVDKYGFNSIEYSSTVKD